jgi:hypothetical protein
MVPVLSKRSAIRAASLVGAVLALAAGVLSLASPARANHAQVSLMMDDDLLVYNTDAVRAFALDFMKRLGVDGVRVTVSWQFVAGDSARRPARLRGARAADPRRYRADIWARFDALVREAQARGMLVLFNVTGPGPRWAHGKAPYSHRFDQAAWKPNAAAFQEFVTAVGRRYTGAYHDLAHNVIPRASLWSIWNEPNQPASLAPQLDWSPLLRREIPVAPILYRELYYVATAALRATGHGSDTILMGETAPLGGIVNTPRVHLWPKLFLRELFCVGPSGRPYTGIAGRARRCDELRRGGPFLISAFAHHPYSQRNPPEQRDSNRDSINTANVGDLPGLLDQLASATHLIPGGLPVWLTEAAWETLPPDPVNGVPLRSQADYINRAQRMAYDQPRVVAETQFILRDVLPRAQFRGQRRKLAQYWSTWQSGLLFANGRPKPSLTAYAVPFDVQVGQPTPDGGQDLRIWGQLRFLPHGTPGTVQLEFRYAGSSRWYAAGDPIQVTDPFGFYELHVNASAPGVWRAVTEDQDVTLYSREVSAAF